MDLQDVPLLICQPFERIEGIYVLQDAICLTQAQWDAITEEEIAAIKQQRWETCVRLTNGAGDPPADMGS